MAALMKCPDVAALAARNAELERRVLEAERRSGNEEQARIGAQQKAEDAEQRARVAERAQSKEAAAVQVLLAAGGAGERGDAANKEANVAKTKANVKGVPAVAQAGVADEYVKGLRIRAAAGAGERGDEQGGQHQKLTQDAAPLSPLTASNIKLHAQGSGALTTDDLSAAVEGAARSEQSIISDSHSETTLDSDTCTEASVISMGNSPSRGNAARLQAAAPVVAAEQTRTNDGETHALTRAIEAAKQHDRDGEGDKDEKEEDRRPGMIRWLEELGLEALHDCLAVEHGYTISALVDDELDHDTLKELGVCFNKRGTRVRLLKAIQAERDKAAQATGAGQQKDPSRRSPPAVPAGMVRPGSTRELLSFARPTTTPPPPTSLSSPISAAKWNTTTTSGTAADGKRRTSWVTISQHPTPLDEQAQRSPASTTTSRNHSNGGRSGNDSTASSFLRRGSGGGGGSGGGSGAGGATATRL